MPATAKPSTDKSKAQRSLYSFFCKVDDKEKSKENDAAEEKKSMDVASLTQTLTQTSPNITVKEVTPDSSSRKLSEKPSLSEPLPQQQNAAKLQLDEDEDDHLFDSDNESPAINRKRKLGSGNQEPQSSSKKKKVTNSLLDSDEEWSANEASESEEDEDDLAMSVSEDSFIADDDDEDDYPKRKKSTAAKKQTANRGSNTKPPKGKSVSISSNKTPNKYSMIVENTPTTASTPLKNPLLIMSSNIITPNSSQSYPATPATPASASSPNLKLLQLPEGVVGQGSHEHNSYDFLKPDQIKDADGHRPDHPDYNPRTLKVPPKYLADQTPAMQQWWQFKAQNMDTVLFFKVGKFYELFHMDADIGFKELDLIYMKGHKAHSGFPEVSYGKFASILVAKGYRVARIEQTETPDMLKERNESAGKGKKDKVVARELCAIMTKGTRTYCHLDDLSLLEEEETLSSSLLVCIKESLLPTSTPTTTEGEETEKGVEAVVEYGITAVDTVIGKVTFGQFQDDRQRTRLRAFLARYPATEILVPYQAVSDETIGVIRLLCPRAALEYLRGSELPENAVEVILALLKAQYFPLPKQEKKIAISEESIEQWLPLIETHWPAVLAAVVKGLKDGSSQLLLVSLGGVLWQLKRSLIDYDVLSMGKLYGYIPPDEEVSTTTTTAATTTESLRSSMTQTLTLEMMDPVVVPEVAKSLAVTQAVTSEPEMTVSTNLEQQKHMVLDEIALSNLEVLVNNYDRTEVGSLWAFINRCKTMGGKRLLRQWLSQPLYQMEAIQRRANAVEELLAPALALTVEEVKKNLKGIPDLERLLIRVHSNGIKRKGQADHPDARAIMFEQQIYTMRKIKDFAEILTGFEKVVLIMESFKAIPLQSPILRFALQEASGSNATTAAAYFPLQEIKTSLQYFRTIFDEKQAKKDGNIKPRPGINPDYDQAITEIENITQAFEQYLKEMKRATGISDLKYFGSGKDRYQIEVPMSQTKSLPADWSSKSQKKTHRRYWTKFIEQQLQRLQVVEEQAIQAQKDTLRSIFEKFDQSRQAWERAAASISFLDALLSLAMVSSLPGYTRPEFRAKSAESGPFLQIVGGRHPMLEYTLQQKNGSTYIPNDVELGGRSTTTPANTATGDGYVPRMLLLTGPNMGGKSTLLRQTCLIVILAQLGCRVPADRCLLTPVDRIFTRVGASDRILAGQSTFFVELAETSLILKAATEDSLCILDELGRGTATFDGTAIAHAVVEHLVSQIRCRSLFATHYHLLIEDWEIDPRIALGHMDCFVQNQEDEESIAVGEKDRGQEVIFLYKLCPGSSPKSYGINVAKLAGMPPAVIAMAIEQSQAFEAKAKEHLAKKGLITKIAAIFERIVSIQSAQLTVLEWSHVIMELWNRYHTNPIVEENI